MPSGICCCPGIVEPGLYEEAITALQKLDGSGEDDRQINDSWLAYARSI
jgi:hypothetical protein